MQSLEREAVLIAPRGWVFRRFRDDRLDIQQLKPWAARQRHRLAETDRSGDQFLPAVEGSATRYLMCCHIRGQGNVVVGKGRRDANAYAPPIIDRILARQRGEVIRQSPRGFPASKPPEVCEAQLSL